MILIALLHLLGVLPPEAKATSQLDAEITSLQSGSQHFDWEGFVGKLLQRFYTQNVMFRFDRSFEEWKAFERENAKRITSEQVTAFVVKSSISLSKESVQWRLDRRRGSCEREVALKAWVAEGRKEVSFELEVSFSNVTEQQLKSAFSSPRQLLDTFADKDFRRALKDGVIDACVLHFSFHPYEPVKVRWLFMAVYDRDATLNEIYFASVVTKDKKGTYAIPDFGRE